MQIGLRSCISALALTSALAAFASPAAAVPAKTSGQTAAAPKPLPAASWHGRPIRRPDRAGLAVVASQGGGSSVLESGAGYGRPNGSLRVKEVQRLLLRIGYRPGPADGMFGPLTRSAVQWFQIKHSLRPTGVVDGATLALLRLRSHGALPQGMPTTAPPQTASPAAPAPAPAVPAQAHKSSGDSAAPAVIAVAAALALLLATLLLLRRRRGREAVAPPTPTPTPAPEPPPAPKPALATAAREPVVGYATGRTPRDLRRQAKAIEDACSERGWTLSQIVRERRTVNGHRPGLRFALEQLAEGAGTRLVACRLGDVGRTRDELAGLLGWCARSGVDLVALDIGLDTGTRRGRFVARSLVITGKRPRIGRPRRGPAFLRRRRAQAPGVDREFAHGSSS